MVFQVEDICIAYNDKKKTLSNSFGNLDFLKRSKYTPGPIGLRLAPARAEIAKKS